MKPRMFNGFNEVLGQEMSLKAIMSDRKPLQ